MTRIKIVLLAGALGRERIQQQRIGQGLSSGQITARGAANLENREAAINTSRTADLAANGGHLTGSEYRNLNRRENSLSRQIYVDKHNDVAQPGVVPR
jgi:hypothetical protein